jgi:hypothetical protein
MRAFDTKDNKMNRTHFQRHAWHAQPVLTAALAAALLAVLAGCGGGDSASPVDLSTSITITGTAATAVNKVATPFANAAVVATCAHGHGTAMTNAEGAYSVKVAGPGVGPCVLVVFKADIAAPYLRTVAAGAGVANITPLTELLTQEISAQVSTTALPVNTNTNTSLNVLPEHPGFAKLMSNQSLVDAAISRVNEIVKTFPAVSATAPALSTPTPPNWLTTPLVVRTATSPGNEQSLFLEALASRGVITATGTVSGTTSAEVIRQGNLNKVTAP